MNEPDFSNVSSANGHAPSALNEAAPAGAELIAHEPDRSESQHYEPGAAVPRRSTPPPPAVPPPAVPPPAVSEPLATEVRVEPPPDAAAEPAPQQPPQPAAEPSPEPESLPEPALMSPELS